jgi:lipopolysaccharide/colanic/teichoic acid biosynthesis glycosyltransferase
MWRRQRSALVLLIDVVCLAMGPFVAIVALRSFDVMALTPSEIALAIHYSGLSIAVGVLVLAIMGQHRGVLRYASLPDFVRIAASVGVAILIIQFLAFNLNRLENVSRALPIIQWLTAVAAMCGVRVLARLVLHQDAADEASAFLAQPDIRYRLVVGVNRVAELYLRSIADLGGRNTEVVGILDENPSNMNRMVRGLPIMGPPAALPQLLRQLHVHGIDVDRVIVAVPLASLSPEGQATLLELERNGEVSLELLTERLGIAPQVPVTAADPTARLRPVRLEELAQSAGLDPRLGGYAYLKSAIDILGAALLIVLLLPVTLLTALAVALDVGMPLLFWQQRPGRNGRPFRIYKFRTMRVGHDADGRRLADEERSSAIGRFLRRTRLDEIPQLYNILMGEMSFIGPRPLLPVDQPSARELRLLVRPGVTGWAQVNGGRELSPDDKNALDLWYIRNASLLVDIRIAMKTALVAIAGERTNPAAVEHARREMTRIATRSPRASASAMPLRNAR